MSVSPDSGSMKKPIPKITNITTTSILKMSGNNNIKNSYNASDKAPFRSLVQKGFIFMLLFALNVMFPKKPSKVPYSKKIKLVIVSMFTFNLSQTPL